MRPARAVLSALAVILMATAVIGAPAAAQGPGLPRTYVPQTIDSANPLSGGSFGWGVTSADVTGDGKLDLLVAQNEAGTGGGGPGQVFVYDGVSGTHVDTINPPESNPDNAANPPVMAFVYVETMPDIGSCPAGDGPDPDRLCDNLVIGAGDGIPEILVGSRNLRVDSTDGSLPPDVSDPRIGRSYVIDGATRAVLKRIDMPPAERSTQSAPQFGRQTISPQALPPCDGSVAENNNAGVGPCPDLHERVRIGDVDGGGQPDIVITARSYVEQRTAAVAGSHCATQTAAPTCTSGKAWVYRGELIAGTSPQAILETPHYSMQNPHAQAAPGNQEFGGNVFRVGDLNADNSPEFVIAARNLFYPLAAPDLAFETIGAAILFSGATGARIRTFQSPEPQPRSQFTGSFNGGRAVGNLGASTLPDVLLPSPLQNGDFPDEGRVWAFNPDPGAGGGAQQSWNFATLDDPTPEIGGNFGGGFTGVGDLVTGPGATGGEVLIGGFHFDTFTEASNRAVMDLHIMNVTHAKELQRIPHPEGKAGDGFGVGLVPMGDLNDDGFLDFAASAYLANVGTNAGQGRAYIFTSDDSPLPPGPSGPPAEEPVTPPLLLAGRCTNETRGTNGPDTLTGTDAGDRIFGFGGNDVIDGLASKDCIHAGRGNDRLKGSGDNDRLIGAQGSDRLNGGDGRDRLYGGPGDDRLAGGVSRDLLAGGPGDDRLSGGPEADRLYGEGGNDRIGVGEGRNFVDAGPGSDRIFARNGERDDLICGTGFDVLVADRVDRIDGSCERVRMPRRAAD